MSCAQTAYEVPGAHEAEARTVDRALLILQLTERALLSLLLAEGNVPAHNAACVLRLESQFGESSEKDLYPSAEQMDGELRTQVPLGSFHPTDARSGPGGRGPSRSAS